MCLAAPAKILKKYDDYSALVDIRSVQLKINISLVDVKEGDWVLIHAGIAINKIDKEMAAETLRILDELDVSTSDI